MPTRKKKKKKSRGINKGVIKFFLWTFAFIAVLILGLIGIAAFYEEGIGKIVVQELKKSLKTDLEIEKAELSLIWDFPRASVTLKNIKLRDTGSDTSKYLLKAGGVSLKCGMFGLLAGSYTFNTIEIKDAELFIKHDKRGKGNYDIFIGSEDTIQTEEPSKLDLKIEDAVFNNVSLQYVDEQAEQDLKIKILSSFFSGQFTNEEYDMTSYANIVSEYIKVGEDSYLKEKELGYNAVIHIDNKTNTYSFSDVELTVEANKFATNGKVALVEEGIRMAIDFKSDKARLNSLLKLLPKSFEKSLGGFESNAKLQAAAKIEGIYSEKELPKMDIQFGLKNGRLTHPLMNSAIKMVSFDLHFANEGGTSDHALFELKNFQGRLGGQPFEAQLISKGLTNPEIDFSANGVLPLKAIYKLLGDDFNNGQGYVQLDELYLKGKFQEMINPRYINRVNLGGVVKFKDAGLVKNGVPLIFKSGTLELKDNIFSIKELAFKSENSDALVNGNFQNVLPVLFSDSLNSKQAELGFKATLQSEQIDADELMAAFSTAAKDEEEIKKAVTAEEQKIRKDSIGQEKNEQREFITQFLNGSFKAAIGKFKYRKIRAENFRGELAFENNTLKIRGLEMDAMKGKLELNAKVIFDKEPQMLAFVDFKKIDIHQLFEQMEDFGQETLQSKHLRGELNSVVKINAFWDKAGNFLDNELVVIADVQLRNGEIINFDMLESFSKYVKVKDLRHIQFTDLRNQFKIENKIFHMPAMFIQSNALNLTISGTHSFDQYIDYKFKINAGQVIANKFKRHNPDMEPLPAKKKGIFNIYAQMYGDLYGDYKFRMGKKHVKKYLDRDLNQELALLTNTLKAEFGKSDLFNERGAATSAEEAAARVTSLKEPDEWDDIPEFEGEDDYGDEPSEDDYIDW
jgi:uncharacterized protein involved in outer membrane biogenesis